MFLLFTQEYQLYKAEINRREPEDEKIFEEIKTKIEQKSVAFETPKINTKINVKKEKKILKFSEFILQNKKKLQILRDTLSEKILEEKMKIDCVIFTSWPQYVNDIYNIKLSPKSEFRRREKILTKLIEARFDQIFIQEVQKHINKEDKGKLIKLLEVSSKKNIEEDSVKIVQLEE